MPLGVYISVPFCRTKCSYCNFASDVFSTRRVRTLCRTRLQRYQKCANSSPNDWVRCFERTVDSIYLGGGTPTVLDATQLERMFVAIRQNFRIQTGRRNYGRMRSRHA